MNQTFAACGRWREVDTELCHHKRNNVDDKRSGEHERRKYAGKTLTFVCLVHKLEELVDYGLEELPMRFEEARILANDVHDIGGDHSLVVLSTLELTQSEKVLDDCHEEAFLCLLVYKRVSTGCAK